MIKKIDLFNLSLNLGSDIPAAEIQYKFSHKDCCGTS